MAVAAPRAQGEAEGGVEAQQVVVGVAEEVQQHLWAQEGRAAALNWGAGHSCPIPTPRPQRGPHLLCLSPPFSVPVSCLMSSLCCCFSAPPCVDAPPHTVLHGDCPNTAHSPAPPTLPEEASMGGGRVLPLRLASRGARGESPSYTNR